VQAGSVTVVEDDAAGVLAEVTQEQLVKRRIVAFVDQAQQQRRGPAAGRAQRAGAARRDEPAQPHCDGVNHCLFLSQAHAGRGLCMA